MNLYIRFGYLHKFENLYRGNDRLQALLARDTGIRWIMDGDDRKEIEGILDSRWIIFNIE